MTTEPKAMEADPPLSPVLVIGPSPDSVGGMATVVSQMASLAGRGGLPLFILPLTESPGPRESIVGKLRRHGRFTVGVRRRIRATRARIVHLHTCSGASFFRSVVDAGVARMCGATVVLHIHGARFDEFFNQANLLTQRVVRSALERAASVVALSQGWKARLLEIAPSARVTVIENAVGAPLVTRPRIALATVGHGSRSRVSDPLLASVVATTGSNAGSCGAGLLPSSTDAADERGAPEAHDSTPVHIVTLARLDGWKGIEDLLHAARILAAREVPFQWTLAGPAGSAFDGRTLNQRIEVLGLAGRVRYVGTVVGPAKSELLSDAEVYVQASHHEGLPLSVLEAMAHGLAVVATSVGATPEFVEPERHGLLVPPGDAPAMARAVQRLIDDPQSRAALARNGVELWRERFSVDRFGRDLVALYRRLERARCP